MKKKLKKIEKALADEPEFKEDGSVNPYFGYTVEDYKRDKKANKKRGKRILKKTLEEHKGTGSPWDGLTVKGIKRDAKRDKKNKDFPYRP